MTARVCPPRQAERLASVLIDDAELRDVILGDLAEGFHQRAVASVRTANRWYWSQIVRSSAAVALMSVARGGWRSRTRVALATLAGACIANAIVFAGELARLRLQGATFSPISVGAGGLSFGYTLYGPEPSRWLTLGLPFTMGLMAVAVGGYIATALGRRSVVPALGVGALYGGVAALSLLFGGDGSPIVLQALAVALIVPSAVGGALAGVLPAKRAQRNDN